MASDNGYKRTVSKSPLDYDRELLATKNKIKWNSWMSVLARCPRYEEEGTLKELAQLNDEFRELISK